MTNKIEEIKEIAKKLHDGVTYGGGLKMYDQVMRCANIATTLDNPELTALAWLHKSQEVKRINTGVSALTDHQILTFAGHSVLLAIQEMNSLDVLEKALEKEGKAKAEIWDAMSEKAATLSPLAQQMLIVEKIANFQTSRDKPNPDWSVTKHQEYLDTRWKMVEACRTSSPELFIIAAGTARTTAVRLSTLTNSAVTSPAKLRHLQEAAEALILAGRS